MLRELGLQTFVTAVSDSLVSNAEWERVQRFRLRQGEVSKVLQ